MKLNVHIFSWDKKAFTARDVERIREVVARTNGAEIGYVHIETCKEVPKVNKGRIDWDWFRQNITLKSTLNSKVVVFHFPKKYKKKWNINSKVNGTYRNDLDTFMEFWMCADKNKKPKGYKTGDTEVSRIFLHELLHGFKRKYGGNSNDVHVYDYVMKDVAVGYFTIKL